MPYTEDRHEPLKDHEKSGNSDSKSKKYRLQRPKGNGVAKFKDLRWRGDMVSSRTGERILQ